MLPGFIPRLYTEIIRTLSAHPVSKQTNKAKRTLPPYDKYSPLRPLLPYFAILNDPNPPAIPTSDRAKSNAGKAPAFVPALMAWVGGSLHPSMKYFSTRGGSERLSFEEVNPHNIKPGLFIIPHRPSSLGLLQTVDSISQNTSLPYQPDWRSKWRSLYFRPALCRRPVLIHLP
jgi:hypothetical protein